MESMHPSSHGTQDATGAMGPPRPVKNMIRIDTTVNYVRDHKIGSADEIVGFFFVSANSI